MLARLEVKHKNRVFVCDVTFMHCSDGYEEDVNIIQCVRVLEIQLSDGTVISREWFADRGLADTVDFLIWDEIEWEKGLLYD